ncbi:thrombospondin-type laminin G domain and EAR repeat-containing protein isoform X2 [Oncorhynchus keta]|uniref:thrombospondin-type laminin G domain and EAR repeat-containing protein isoform X2 n=1 Tax=Oncorhynchus keta TaxID=8018 RepID=UPI00227C1838|nr:thrombospondin-type laminin G domain and EAR repeat-containing protein isoform X2 [Oncorhynchus keta]
MSSPMLLLPLLLFLGLRVVNAAAETRRPCSDLLPLDLLSRVLSRAGEGARGVTGGRVHLIQSGGVMGVRLSRPHPSLDFPSSQHLVNCHLFPREFSIVTTLKVSLVAPKKNEYIFSVVEEKEEEDARIGKRKGETQGGTDGDWYREKDGERGGRDDESDEERDGETDGGGERLMDGEKRKGSRDGENSNSQGRLLIGLRFSRDRLHFLFRGRSGGVMARWVFRGIELADDRWHTLVLAFSGHYATLTVDCNTHLELVHSKSLPSDLSVQGSRFHIGSRGRWNGLFSGLIRQLVLVPGSDATPRVCPSSNPGLAELFVPAVLLDLPQKETRSDLTLPSYESEVRVSVGLEKSCSSLVRGQLWFNPIRRALYLCDGTLWVPMLQESQRLDYVLEQQVLSTSSETYDIEVFSVQGLGLMAAMAHRSPSLGSAVYLWRDGGFHLYQKISTHGALSWRHFTMGKKIFLVVSNSRESTGKEETVEKDELSVIYRWNKKTQRFVHYQALQTHCARDWEAFRIQGHTYLAVANHRQGNTNHTIDSVVYKWDRGTQLFVPHQALRTSGAYDWEAFTVGPYHFLAVANAFDGQTTHVDSVIYVWVDGSFRLFQTIKTFCATDWEMFQIGSRVFLVVANGHQLHGNGPGRYAINSTIYELDMSSQLFLRFQDIVTYSAVDWEFFTVGEESYLVVANSFDGESHSLNSIIYRWQGYEGFVPIHRLPTIGCSDWEFFTSGEDSYLIYSSATAPLSKVFRLKTH